MGNFLLPNSTDLILAIARHIIVDKYGETIDVNSRVRERTKFIINLPIKGE